MCVSSEDERVKSKSGTSLTITDDQTCADLPVVLTDASTGEVVARVARRATGVCFAVAYAQRGWQGSPAPSIGATVLVVIEHGCARAYSSGVVDVAVVDLDCRRSGSYEDLAPLDPQYAPLLRLAELVWPLSAGGRRDASRRLDDRKGSSADAGAAHRDCVHQWCTTYGS